MTKLDALISECENNFWLRSDEYCKTDYCYSIVELFDMDELVNKLSAGNVAIRSGWTYKTLAFVQQVNGSNEFLTLKFMV